MTAFLHCCLATTLAAWLPLAWADTIYKCAQADGRIGFSSQPCQGQAQQVKQLTVPAPEPDHVSAARLARERVKLRAAELRFRMRQGNRDSGAGASVHVAKIPQARPADKARAERDEAARLNAARIGNCSMRRPEANCL
jgi:hypothetical protein